MSNAYNPLPWQSPSPGGVQRPMSVQSNVQLPGDASQQDVGLLMQVAQGIVASNASGVDRFVANQRQQQALNGQGYRDVSIKLDGMTARWRINHGVERLDLEVYPFGGGEQRAQTSDTDLDGYICWVHFGPADLLPYTGQVADGPYNIILNGYLIEQNYMPTKNTGGYPILFGKTAFLEPSYVGDQEGLQIEGPTLKAQKVLPPQGWGTYLAGNSPTGRTQKAYPKTFGYWLLDWLNVLNP